MGLDNKDYLQDLFIEEVKGALNGYCSGDHNNNELAIELAKVKAAFTEHEKHPVNNNILINSNFANPVNQRGITSESWTANADYGLDRWTTFTREYLKIVRVSDDGITVQKTATGTDLVQKIESKDVKIGRNYTLSAFVDGKIISGTVMTTNVSTPLTAYEDESLQMFLYYTGSGFTFYFRFKDTAEHTIKWAKLEEGTVATPYVPRLYAEELELCKRYYRKISTEDSTLRCLTSDTCEFGVSFDDMRITPTVSQYNLHVAKDTEWIEGFTFNVVQNENWLNLICSKPSHGLNRNNMIITMRGYIFLDAEL